MSGYGFGHAHQPYTLKAKWLKALRSGRYHQGDSYLRCAGAFCCLGVLAQIQGARWKEEAPYIGGELASPDEEQSTILHARFAGGLSKKSQELLASMNDGNGKWDGKPQDFKQIADYIQKRY